jgi:hypothetical protein
MDGDGVPLDVIEVTTLYPVGGGRGFTACGKAGGRFH